VTANVMIRGVATGWTGVDMSTPLLPEVTPEIDINPVSFLGEGAVMAWSFTFAHPHPSLPCHRGGYLQSFDMYNHILGI